MKTRLAVLLIAVVAVSSPMFTGLATAGTAANTIVTIKGPNGDFHGKIKSPDPWGIDSCGSSCPTAPTARSPEPAIRIRRSNKAA